MNRKEFVKDYLSFTRKERIGLLTIGFLILVVVFLPRFVNNGVIKVQATGDTSWISAARRLEIRDSVSTDKPSIVNRQREENNYSYRQDQSTERYTSRTSLFNFDPNTIDAAGWKSLGLKDKTIHTIQNYINKGGHFYKPEDLGKIYGLHPNDYRRLEPFVRIERKDEHDALIEPRKSFNEPKTSHLNSIDINTADTSAFQSLPGIGSKLASRIVAFREKLGGFYSISQIGETYGLADTTFQKISQYLVLGNLNVRKININTASLDELRAHPYIKNNLAAPIVAYRNEHGPFAAVADIKKVMAVTYEVFKKVEPYLTLQ